MDNRRIDAVSFTESITDRVEQLRKRFAGAVISPPELTEQPARDSEKPVEVDMEDSLRKFLICQVPKSDKSWKTRHVYCLVWVKDWLAGRQYARRYGDIVARMEARSEDQAKAKWERDLKMRIPVKSQGKVGDRVTCVWQGTYSV